jgi:hypothetical protein
MTRDTHHNKTAITAIKALPVFIVLCMIALVSHAFAMVTIQEQVVLNGYSFYGKAVLDLIDINDNTTSYESDSSGNFNFQLSQPGVYDVNIRHNSGDFEWKQYFACSFVEGINSISAGSPSLNYNPDHTLYVPADYPTIQGALDAIQDGGWVIVSAQNNPYAVNGLQWENKHVKLLGQPGAALTLGWGNSSHAIFLVWSGINRTDLIRGFTFQNCTMGINGWDKFGPAITLINGASPKVEYCNFTGNNIQSSYSLNFNSPEGFGGAVYIDGGSNQAQSPYFNNCNFSGNFAGNASGGGAVALFGPGEFVNCGFTGNWTTTASGTGSAYFAAGAILIASEGHSGNMIIDNCTFNDNYGQCKANDIWIAESIGISEVRITNSTFNQSVSYSYDQPVLRIFDSSSPIQPYATAFYVQGNRFNLTNRGAVDFHDGNGVSSLWFTKNTIIGVNSGKYGLYLWSNNPAVQGQNYFSFDNNTLRNLTDSGLVLFQGSSYTINNNLFDNCSPYDIKWAGSNAGLNPTAGLTINNSYFNDLVNHVDTQGNYQQSYAANNLVVAASPQLGTNQEPLWNSSVISPVIDKGVTSLSDPDGTPSDIGAIRAVDHNYDAYTMPYGNTTNIKWMSFPVLNRITSGHTTNSSFFAPILYESILDWVDWKEEDDSRTRMEYTISGLINDNATATSTVGYKVQLKSAVVNEIKINTPGFIQAPTTVLNLYKYQNGTTTINENWLGYFQTDSAHPFDAFASVMDYLTYIQTQNWSMSKVSDGVWKTTSADPTINYGDMVIVKVNQDCSFVWNNSQPVDPKYIKIPQSFTFSEKADYIPLYIEFEEDKSLELPTEIGLYVNGICKGATVVEGSEAQICAYLDENEQITAENSELVFWYDSKATTQNRINCKMTSGALTQNRDFGNLFYSFVVDGKTELNPIIPTTNLGQNYPNPFNPTTTIAYDLAEKGHVSIEIYNVKGQKVTTLVNETKVSGPHRVVWNGTDKYGRNVASGLYNYRLTTKAGSITKKMLLMK